MSSTSDDAVEAAAAATWREAFEPRAQAWSQGRGLVALLNSLEVTWPHTFARAAARERVTHPTRMPWEPADEGERAILQAYKRATLHLHPDRLSRRDLSVRVEAEEVLKVLTRAHADRDAWLDKRSTTISEIR